MLSKIKLAFGGAFLAAVGGFIASLEVYDWKVALPAAALPFVGPVFGFLKTEGFESLKGYLTAHGYHDEGEV